MFNPQILNLCIFVLANIRRHGERGMTIIIYIKIFIAYLGPPIVVEVEDFPAKDNLFDPSLLFKTVFIRPKTRLNPFFLSSFDVVGIVGIVGIEGTAGALGAPCAEELIVAGSYF